MKYVIMDQHCGLYVDRRMSEVGQGRVGWGDDVAYALFFHSATVARAVAERLGLEDADVVSVEFTVTGVEA